jgi:hypothetical protein
MTVHKAKNWTHMSGNFLGILALLLASHAVEANAQETPASFANQTKTPASNSRSRSRPSKTTKSVDTSRWKRRAGLKLTLGAGGGIGEPMGTAFVVNGSLGFFHRNYAVQFATYLTGLVEVGNEAPSSRSFLMGEVEIYSGIRRKVFDTYFILGAGAVDVAQGAQDQWGPAGLAGVGINLWGGEYEFSKIFTSPGLSPFIGVHLRLPLVVYGAGDELGLIAAGLIVLECSYQ